MALELMDGAAVIGRALKSIRLERQGPPTGAVPSAGGAPAAPKPAAQKPAPAATAPPPAAPAAPVAQPMTGEQKKLLFMALLLRVDGARENVDEAMEDMDDGTSDLPEGFSFVSAYRGAVASVIEMGKKQAETADWTAADAAFAKADAVLTRSANEWNAGMQSAESKKSLKAALEQYRALEQAVRGVLKGAGLL